MADICFIDSVCIGHTYGTDAGDCSESLWYPEFDPNQERYIKSLTILCTCYL